MAVLSSLLSYLGTKGVAAAGAATLMVGGGVAVAQTGGLDLAQDRVPDEVELPVDDQDLDDDETDTDAEAETRVEEPVSDDDPISSLEVEECPTEDPDCEPAPVDCDTDPDDACPEQIEDECDEEVAAEDESTDGEATAEETSVESDCRSETAKRVHEALTDGAVDDAGEPIVPGHPDFGATVSERAKDPEVHLGREVSEAARGGESEPEGDDIEELSAPDTDDADSDEGAGKPDWAGQPGGPNGQPQR